MGQTSTSATLVTPVTPPSFPEDVQEMAKRRTARGQPKLITGNLLVYGDNLRVMRESAYFRDESVDLIYLDPPFKHDEKYNVLFRARTGTPSQSQVRAFDDAWNWEIAAKDAYHDVKENSPLEVRRTIDAMKTILDQSDMFAYLCMMAPRLGELHRVLRDSGSIYLHCDSAASHYLKMLMDAVFGPENFKNEIVWRRTAAKGDARRKFGAIHDVLLLYGKTEAAFFQSVRREPDEKYRRRFRHDDGDGRGPYQSAPLDSPNPRPNLTYVYKGYEPPAKGWRVKKTLMEELDAQGRLIFPPKVGGRIREKNYLNEQEWPTVGDVWTDITPLQSRNRIGYPTEKPPLLLERIIQASSQEGEVVLDPFCGCGTTIAAAQSLKRKWIGIDVAYEGIRIIRDRLQEIGLHDGVDYEVWGDPESLEDALSLAKEHEYQFQWWAVRRLGARDIDYKRGADRGVDGRLVLRVDQLDTRLPEAIIQVKAGKPTRSHMAQLIGDYHGENVELGVLVTREKATPAMRADADRIGEYTADGKTWYPRIQLLTAEDIIAGKGVQYPAILPAKRKVAGSSKKTSGRRRVQSPK